MLMSPDVSVVSSPVCQGTVQFPDTQMSSIKHTAHGESMWDIELRCESVNQDPDTRVGIVLLQTGLDSPSLGHHKQEMVSKEHVRSESGLHSARNTTGCDAGRASVHSGGLRMSALTF